MQPLCSDFPLQPECFYGKQANIQNNLVRVQRVFFLITGLLVSLISLNKKKISDSLSVMV